MKILYPPRPKNAVSPIHIDEYENKALFGQPKANGSQLVLYMNERDIDLRNRHRESITNVKMDKAEFRKLYRGKGQMILCGEYMNKNKKHINGTEFNHKYLIFDIIMYNGVYLLGQSFEKRQQLLDILFPKYTNFDGFIRKVDGDGLENVYRMVNFYENFRDVYDALVSIDMYEGLVFKKRFAGLEAGVKVDNNHLSQFKIRKPTLNYAY
jgi:hypothetical protein